jgi:hypothetical protein
MQKQTGDATDDEKANAAREARDFLEEVLEMGWGRFGYGHASRTGPGRGRRFGSTVGADSQ